MLFLEAMRQCSITCKVDSLWSMVIVNATEAMDYGPWAIFVTYKLIRYGLTLKR